jgi:hypothetical protein
MKFALTIITVILTLVSAAAQSPDFTWIITAGGTGFDRAHDMVVDNDGNYIITGEFSDAAIFGSTQISSLGSSDIFIVKYDQNENLVWVNSAGSPGYDYGRSVAVDNAGNVIVTGIFSGTVRFSALVSITSLGNFDVFTAKYSGDGNLLWVKSGGSGDFDYSTGITTDNLNNVIITGTFQSSISFDDSVVTSQQELEDIFIVKYDPDGNVIWAHNSGGNYYYSFSSGVTTNNNNEIIITGFAVDFIATQGSPQIFLNKYSPDGSLIWESKASEAGPYGGGVDVITDDGFIYFVGSFSDTISFGNISLISQSEVDIFIAKYDNNGNPVWVIQDSPAAYIFTGGITLDEAGNVYIIANRSQFLESPGEVIDIFTAKYNRDGILVWSKLSGSLDNDEAGSIAVDLNGDVLITGSYSDNADFGNFILPSLGSEDIFLAKLPSPGLSFNPASVNFDTLLVGEISTQTVILNNTTNADLTIFNISIFGAAAQDFSVSGLIPAGIPALSSESLTLQFSPVVIGTRTAFLIVESDAPSSPDSITLQGEGVSSIVVQLEDTANIGEAVRMNVTPPPGLEILSAALFYKRTGELTFQQEDLILTDTLYSGNIPAEYSTIRGIQYYLSFSDGLETVTFPPVNPSENPASIEVRISEITYPGSIVPGSYQMVSVPIDIDNPDVLSVFGNDYGEYNDRIWRLFRWEPLQQDYIEFPAVNTISPGNGYWLIERNGKSFNITGGISVQPSGGFTVSLLPGWNQLSMPFAFPVAWSLVENYLLVDPPWKWDPLMRDYTGDQLNLEPWEGYFVFNPLSQVVDLIIPPIEIIILPKENIKYETGKDEFLVRLKAKLSSSDDSDNYNFVWRRGRDSNSR